MTHQTPQPTPQQTEDAQYYRHILHTLIDMGAAIAKTLHDHATSNPAPQDPAHAHQHAIAFDRIARAVRRTILLAQKITEPPRPQPAAAPTPEALRRAARRRILREVEDSIHQSAKPAAAEALKAELRDRLDAPELAETLDEDLRTRPIERIIEDIRRDLGLATAFGPRGWKRRRPGDIAALNARAATPSTPFPPPAESPPHHASG